MRRCAVLHFAFSAAAGMGADQFHISGGFCPAATVWDAPPRSVMCGTRADLQTAGLNGVFAHFCRCWQKWVAPESEISLTAAERNGAAGGERMGRVGAVSAIILHISGKFLLVPLFSRLETFPASGAEFARKWRSLAYMSSMLTTSEFPFDFISAKFMEMVLT
mgnify:CR=1 FL=1